MRARIALGLTFVLALSGLASAHLFNHQSRHEDCKVFGDPHLDRIGDGHAHTHDVNVALALNLHNHDPCKQVGMRYPSFPTVGGLREITVEEAVLGDSDPMTTDVIVDDEAYRLPVASLDEQTNLLATKDASLAALGLPGSGTPADPYVIEGYLIRNVLQLKDTNACVVVRNNVVQSDGIVGPLVDPLLIVDLEALRAELAALATELADLVLAQAEAAAARDASRAGLDAQLADWQAQANEWETQATAWRQQNAAFADDLAAFEARNEALADEYEAFALAYQTMPAPPKVHEEAQTVTERTALLGGYLDAVDSYAAQTAPPAEPPADWVGDWEAEKAEHQAYLQRMRDELLAFELDLMERQPDAQAHQEFQAQHAAFQAAYAAFQAEREGALALLDAQAADDAAAMAGLQEELDAARAQLDGTAGFLFAYGDFLYNTLDELIQHVLELARDLLDDLHTGRLVLDWNGQCVHAYNNVVEDLRVNQNNDRTGYATGGILEQNRFGTIGQIRHYDGEFRRNEVGDRDHLRSLVDPTVTAPAADRAINNDGANQGWFHDNLVYGQVDLDFHGHHHGAGFFSPESHYHGSDQVVSYMRNPDGTWMLDATGNKIPHHDHAKRWTSVLFEDNTVIDPKGVGLRFEDLNHRGDDAQANSENMRELNMPHIHRSFVRLLDNLVVGRMSVEVFNADGVDLWSDTYTEVKAGLVDGTVDAVQHLGADIVNSHPQRNDGWLDIQGNSVFLVAGGSAYTVTQAKEIAALSFKANRAYVVGAGADTKMDEAGLLAFLKASPTRAASAVHADVQSWGGARGPAVGFTVAAVKDSAIQVCNNSILGYTTGMRAVDMVYDSTIIATCSTNNWGASNPHVDVQFTPTPEEAPRATQPLRDVTDGTDARYVVAPTYDEADKAAAPVAGTAGGLGV